MAVSESHEVALELRDVSKIFPGVKALDNVDLTVNVGEVHGIVGENGAGKSTLMAVASGALTPESGSVLIQGRPLSAGSTRRASDLGIAIVRQEPALLPDLSVAENLWLGTSEDDRPTLIGLRAWASELLGSWSPDVGIDPDSRIEELTAEQRFIVDIVRALAQKPAVLVLDEPTEHLAKEDVERLFVAVRARVRDGGAVIYISHRVREVKQIADRISVLRDGAYRGTYDAATLTEDQIVDLIVGRALGTEYPAKRDPPGSEDVVLQVQQLSGGGFEDISFEVRAGEIVGFAGIEGNGQRDALRAMAGLNRFRGSIRIDGDAARPRSSKSLAYLTGDRHREGIFPGLTVAESIALRNLDSISKGGIVSLAREREMATRTVAELGVRTPTVSTSIETLSGGNQQKTLLGAVLAQEPRVLLIDEPTQGVDVGAKSEIYELLRKHGRERGMAIVVVSSDGRELAGLCDRILIFSRGQVVVELDGDEVTESRITGTVLTATTHRAKVEKAGSKAVRWLSGDSAPVALVVLAAVLLGVFTAMKSEFYLQPVNVTGTLTLVAILAFVAMGQSVALMVGAIDLSVGPLMGFVVVVQSFFLTVANGPAESAIGWAMFVVVPLVVGVVNWALVDVVKLNSIVATLMTFIALQALSLLLRDQPEGVFQPGLTAQLTSTIGTIPVAFIAAVIVAGLLQYILKKTQLGLNLRAVGSEPDASRLNGVQPAVTRLIGFCLCSLLASAAALLLMAQVGIGDPTAGVSYTLTSISAAVIGGASVFGGRGSFIGAIAAAFLVTQAIGAIQFLGLGPAWASYLPAAMALIAVAAYSKSRQIAARSN
jgi:ribose transport system ATP-binding protein